MKAFGRLNRPSDTLTITNSNPVSDLIKWSELSRKLSGSDNSIRPNKIPKKYEKDIGSLLKALDKWEDSLTKEE